MPGNQSFNLNLNTDHSKKLSFNLGNYHGSGDALSSGSHEYWAGIYYRPTNSVSISFEPDYSIGNTELQYVSTVGSGRKSCIPVW